VRHTASCSCLLNTLVNCLLIEDGQLADLLSVEPRLCLGEVLEVKVHTVSTSVYLSPQVRNYYVMIGISAF